MNNQHLKYTKIARQMYLDFSSIKEVYDFLIQEGIKEENANKISRETYIKVKKEVDYKRDKIHFDMEHKSVGGSMGKIVWGLILMISPVAITLFTGYIHLFLIVAFFVGIYLLVNGIMTAQTIKKTRSDVLDD